MAVWLLLRFLEWLCLKGGAGGAYTINTILVRDRRCAQGNKFIVFRKKNAFKKLEGNPLTARTAPRPPMLQVRRVTRETSTSPRLLPTSKLLTGPVQPPPAATPTPTHRPTPSSGP